MKAALNTAKKYGTIHKGSAVKSSGRFPTIGTIGKHPLETTISSAKKTVVIGSGRPLVIIGERINPTGRKDLAAALERGDLRAVQKEAIAQAEAGAHILDVNVGVSGIDEPRILQEAIAAISEVTDLPLCIDSALPKALEAALKVYKGKALVNSVNGEKGKAGKDTPPDKGVWRRRYRPYHERSWNPEDRQRNGLKSPETIVEKALDMGIPAEDVIIDPLAMAISADSMAGVETIRALRLIRDRLHVNQTLGLSNISFGLPDRNAINAGFLAMAVDKWTYLPDSGPYGKDHEAGGSHCGSAFRKR